MASNEKGTGQHKHKSSEKPYPHHESGRDEKSGRQSGSSDREERSGRQSGSSEREESSRRSGSESGDLKSREYKDNQGEVHHHTHTYMEQHDKK